MNNNSQNITAQDNAEHTASEVGRRRAPRFALIIGIDGYTNCQTLRGAVADAKAMKQYLKEVHQMSEDHIVTLYNEEATRGAIIKAFQNFPEDKRIEKGDPIVIFYAGHGSELPAPPAWRLKGGVTQCLLPQDYDATGIMPIPDRTVGALIEDIAKAKGDNITVIFDCCHSASGTRHPDDPYVPRTVELDLDIPKDLDIRIWGLRAGKFPGEFAYHGLRSHVLLAACGEKERAYEHQGRGQFTSALLSTLESCAVKDVTYTEVLERIHLDRQHAHCEGLNRHRILFDTRVPAGRHVWHSVRAETGKYVIGAGLSHGVAPGVEFTLYNDRRLWLGTALVDGDSSIDDFETTITTSVQLEDVSLAKVTRVGKVPLYLGNYSVLEETLRGMNENDTISANFRVVEDVKEAKLQVAMENNTATFEILDQRVRSLGLTEIPHRAALNSLPRILGAAAHYFWYLDLKNKDNRLGSNQEVTVNFYFLNKEYDDFGTPLFVPVEPGFCRKDPDSSNSDLIDFVVDPKGRYGIEIKNNTPRDLYLNAFLFNNSSLTIVPWHTLASVASAKPDALLKRNGTFTIGYGPGGTAPLSFSLEGGQDVDVSYLKIFLATRHTIDLSDIEQMSPFSDVHPPPQADRRVGDNLKGQATTHARDIWFTFLIPVVQRRREVDAMMS